MVEIKLPLMDIPNRDQKATWWQKKSVTQGGQFTYENPVEIDCRWDDEIMEFVDANNTKQFSKAVVYPDRYMENGDILILKAPHLLDFPNDPKKNLGYSEIRNFQQIPDYDQGEVLFIAML